MKKLSSTEGELKKALLLQKKTCNATFSKKLFTRNNIFLEQLVYFSAIPYVFEKEKLDRKLFKTDAATNTLGHF